MQHTRLLGVAPLPGADALLAAMNTIAGPEVKIHRSPAGSPMLAALCQAEPNVPLFGRGREAMVAGLRTVQRRLEAACQAGAFLAADPSAACCPTAGVQRLLAPQWDALAAVLARHGARQQWDIVLTWAGEGVVARHRAEIAPAAASGPQALGDAVAAVLRRERTSREAALIAALTPVVLQFAAGGAACTDTSVALTILIAPGSEAAVEAALDAMTPEHVQDAAIDMRGPLPPVSFAAVRIETVDKSAISAAWATLGLADRVDLSALHRQWRMRASEVHPDRQLIAADGSVAGITDAYRLLRGLSGANAGGLTGGLSLGDLTARAGPRLVMPADGPNDNIDPITPAHTADPVLELIA